MDATSGVQELAHNKVDGADEALKVLQQLKREFAPLLRKRGWTVLKLQEMCCCAKGGGIARSPNILGMCHTTGRGSQAIKIEIRVREPGSHSLKDYEYEVVSTMCHELSHIVHGNHSAEFYKLMEEVRAEFDATRSSAGADGRGSFAGAGDKSDPDRHNTADPREARRRAAAAAEARARKQRIMPPPGGQRLGGGEEAAAHVLCAGGAGCGRSWRDVPPRELAAWAAERRRRDDGWCPSAAPAVAVEAAAAASSSSLSSLGAAAAATSAVARGVARGKTAAPALLSSLTKATGPHRGPQPTAAPASDEAASEADLVDLTASPPPSPPSPASRKRPAPLPEGGGSCADLGVGGCACCRPGSAAALLQENDNDADGAWGCPSCTLLNPPLTLACVACALERPTGA